jgi:hypothetical protein
MVLKFYLNSAYKVARKFTQLFVMCSQKSIKFPSRVNINLPHIISTHIAAVRKKAIANFLLCSSFSRSLLSN